MTTLNTPTIFKHSTLTTTGRCTHGLRETRIEVYCDGSAKGNPGPGGWGFIAVLLDETGKALVEAERYGQAATITTNNRTELSGAIAALNFVSEQQRSGAWPTCAVTVVSDSQYLVKGYTEWLPAWEARGWRTSVGKAPDNRDKWDRLKAATEGLSVSWRWVKGHSGNKWNDRADELATKAAKEAARKGVTFRECTE